nr:MAG TPA: hypothetical protein [Caudoviricetes sp.]
MTITRHSRLSVLSVTVNCSPQRQAEDKHRQP